MKYHFIINPAAGHKNTSAEWSEKIKKVCDEKQLDYAVYVTTDVGDAYRYANEAAEDTETEHCFWACGGDGTAGEVADALALKKHCAMGIIPIGTGNDFVRNFTENNLFFDVTAQVTGTAVPINLLGMDDGTYALNMINIGFDCEVVKRTAQIKRRPWVPKGMAYLFGVLETLIKKPGLNAKMIIDGKLSETKQLLLTAIGNGSYCGGGYYSLPFADMTGEYMGRVSVLNVGRLRFLRLVGEYKNGTYVTGKARKVAIPSLCKEISFDFAKPQAVCVDGEIVTKEHLTVRAVASALRFIIPKGSAIKPSCPLT